MKLPFLLLPRTVYDDLRGDLAARDKQIAALQQLLLDLKLDGAQIVRANPEIYRRKQERPDIDLIDEAIETHPKAKHNPGMKRGWRRWADEQLAQGKDIAWVVTRIRTWDRADNASTDDEDEEDRRMGLIAS